MQGATIKSSEACPHTMARSRVSVSVGVSARVSVRFTTESSIQVLNPSGFVILLSLTL